MVEQTKQQFLGNIPLFKGLEHVIDKIAPLFEKQEFESGTIVFQQAKLCPGFYLIKSGRIKVNVQVIGDKHSTLGILKEKRHFGEISLLEGGDSSATVIAEGKVTVYCLSLANIVRLRASLPTEIMTLKINVAKETCFRVRYINELVKKNFLFYEIQHATVKKSRHDESEILRKVLFIEHSQKIDADIEKIMMRLKFFRDLEPDELTCLCKHVRCFSAPKSTALYHEGDKGSCFYLSLLGAVQAIVYYGGKFSKLALYGPGEIFGQITYIDQKPHMTSALLREEALFLEFNASVMDIIKNENYGLWVKIHDLLFLELAKILRNIEKLFTRSNMMSEQDDV